MSADREQKIIDKCLRCYGRKRSLLRVEKFLNRINKSSGLHFEEVWPRIRRQFFPDLTVDRLLEYALNCYRGCPDVAPVFETGV
jgi:hypothetical protein